MTDAKDRLISPSSVAIRRVAYLGSMLGPNDAVGFRNVLPVVWVVRYCSLVGGSPGMESVLK